ncbi:hypothetical protein GE061_018266 [Apolygus lucorum]|uniref:RRM domain-containing protein n=1 Tax=Apolygus lucorum TaxID=248454 RepID=A0A6A4IW98_APOLU|nr:hypothetical protein GE061_018266 [Apolygus lucorum]
MVNGENLVEPKVLPKRSTRASSSEKSPTRVAPRRSTRASSADKSPPPASKRQSIALSKIPEESQKKPSTPSKTKVQDEVPTVGTPKRRGRASLNPTPAAVASPVRVTRRSVAALAEEVVPVVSSPRRKSRASINPASTASPARVTRNSLATQAEESENHAERLPTRSRRKTMMPDQTLETEEEELEKETPPLPKVEESSESAKPEDDEKDTKTSKLPVPDRTPEQRSARSRRSNQSESGSADDKTPESRIPTRTSRNNTPTSELRTPTRAQSGSKSSTPGSRPGTPVAKSISDLKESAKQSPDRHANCGSRESSPSIASRDLRRNSFSSPRQSPRSSPSRQPRLSFGGSKDDSPKSTGSKPTSPLVTGKTATPSKLKNDQSKSSPKVVTVPEKHALEDEDGTLMPNKRIKRDPADKDETSCSNEEKSPKKKLSYHTEPEQEKENASPDSETVDPQHVPTDDEAVVELSDEGAKSNPSIPGITKITDVESSQNNFKVVEGNDTVPDVNSVEEPVASKEEGSLELSEGPTEVTKISGEESPIPTDEARASSPVLETASGNKLKRQDTFVKETSGKEDSSGEIDEVLLPEASEEKVERSAASNDEGEIQSPVLDSILPAENADGKLVEEVQQENEDCKQSPTQDAPVEFISSENDLRSEQVEEGDERQDMDQTVIVGDEEDESLITAAACESEEGRKSVEVEVIAAKGEDEHQELECSETSVTEIDSNQTKAVTNNESVVDGEIPDVPKEDENPESSLKVSPDQCDSVEGQISDQSEATDSSNCPILPEGEKSFEDPAKSKSEEVEISNQNETLCADNSQDVSEEEESSKDSAKCESEESKIADQAQAADSSKSPNLPDDEKSFEPSVKPESVEETESLEVESTENAVKAKESLDSSLKQLNTEHILVDEGYSETSDSEYQSSGKEVKVPSIVEGLGLEVGKDTSVQVNLASQSDCSITHSHTILNDIAEHEDIVEKTNDIEELKLSVSETVDEQFVSNDSNVEATVDEQENTDQPSLASPLGLALSPEPSNTFEDESSSKGEVTTVSPGNDVAASETGSVADKKSEVIDTSTVLGKLGLRKHVEVGQTNEICEEEKCEGDNEREECSTEIYENETTSVGDSEEDKRDEVTSKNNEKSIDEDVEEIQKETEESEIYENDTASDVDNCGNDLDKTVRVSDFIDDEAEEGEETDEESDDENIAYDYDDTEENDSDGSDVELLDKSNFIIDQAKEQRLSVKNRSNDNVVILDVTSEEAGDGSDAEASKENPGKAVEFDESCYIVEDPSDDEQKTASIPEPKISPKADKPVFEVNQIADTDATAKRNIKEFASGAASKFVTGTKTSAKSLKSILKNSKSTKNDTPYTSSAAASQFVVIEGKQKKKQSKSKGSDASTGSPGKSDSSFTSSDQEQENAGRVPKSKKRPAAEPEPETLKENKKSRLDNAASGFFVKLCNVAPGTSIVALREALGKFGIASGLLSLEFCPPTEKQKRTAIAVYDTRKNLEKALKNYGKVVVQGRRIFFLSDDETSQVEDKNQPIVSSPKKSPRKKFVGIISNLAENITIGDICSAYEEEGIKYLSQVKLYKIRSSKNNFAKLEFSKKTALLKAIIVTDKIVIKGSQFTLKIKEKSSSP